LREQDIQQTMDRVEQTLFGGGEADSSARTPGVMQMQEVTVTFVGEAPLGLVLRMSGSERYTLMIEGFQEFNGRYSLLQMSITLLHKTEMSAQPQLIPHRPGAAETYNLFASPEEMLQPGMMVTHANDQPLTGRLISSIAFNCLLDAWHSDSSYSA
jgi:hypothetical protein